VGYRAFLGSSGCTEGESILQAIAQKGPMTIVRRRDSHRSLIEGACGRRLVPGGPTRARRALSSSVLLMVIAPKIVEPRHRRQRRSAYAEQEAPQG
jgi:hypothetical protein